MARAPEGGGVLLAGGRPASRASAPRSTASSASAARSRRSPTLPPVEVSRGSGPGGPWPVDHLGARALVSVGGVRVLPGESAPRRCRRGARRLPRPPCMFLAGGFAARASTCLNARPPPLRYETGAVVVGRASSLVRATPRGGVRAEGGVVEASAVFTAKENECSLEAISFAESAVPDEGAGGDVASHPLSRPKRSVSPRVPR